MELVGAYYKRTTITNETTRYMCMRSSSRTKWHTARSVVLLLLAAHCTYGISCKQSTIDRTLFGLATIAPATLQIWAKQKNSPIDQYRSYGAITQVPIYGHSSEIETRKWRREEENRKNVFSVALSLSLLIYFFLLWLTEWSSLFLWIPRSHSGHKFKKMVCWEIIHRTFSTFQ